MAEEIGLFAETDEHMDHTQTETDVEPAKPQLVFGSAEEFLHEQLLPTYVRDVDNRSAKWCMEWYFHPEAVSRVEALWRAWEHLRLDGATGISVWWRDHADHMRVLLDPNGPFYNCDKSGHRDPAYLEPKRAPLGWFPDMRLRTS
ncbi:hypothetical protein J2X01_002545 [Arthrobacter ginsengisoli]|uniref:DUF4913 domain-containing protein n=1 Tax=Arthrobacter ginsengisoli TaxID=1356565 RepID=A0ABU1UDK8_9MICC|nr:DUF4913 domain-containing protein [Arthrobacter ginsengisoli]MDR7083251.1 hypothetical protein [Arthrobacter ginsengisoli]